MDTAHYIKDFQFYYSSQRRALNNCCLLIFLIFNFCFIADWLFFDYGREGGRMNRNREQLKIKLEKRYTSKSYSSLLRLQKYLHNKSFPYRKDKQEIKWKNLVRLLRNPVRMGPFQLSICYELTQASTTLKVRLFIFNQKTQCNVDIEDVPEM